MTPGAIGALTSKFMQKGWIDNNVKPSEEALVHCACGKIREKASEFQTFLGMLKDMAGMNTIVEQLEGYNYNSLSCTQAIRRHIIISVISHS